MLTRYGVCRWIFERQYRFLFPNKLKCGYCIALVSWGENKILFFNNFEVCS